eukprot:117482-Chlamydomonas_euryale.AAC.6
MIPERSGGRDEGARPCRLHAAPCIERHPRQQWAEHHAYPRSVEVKCKSTQDALLGRSKSTEFCSGAVDTVSLWSSGSAAVLPAHSRCRCRQPIPQIQGVASEGCPLIRTGQNSPTPSPACLAPPERWVGGESSRARLSEPVVTRLETLHQRRCDEQLRRRHRQETVLAAVGAERGAQKR